MRVAGQGWGRFDSHSDYKRLPAPKFRLGLPRVVVQHSLELINDGELSLSTSAHRRRFVFAYSNGDGTIHSEQRSNVSMTYAPTSNEASQAIRRIIIKQIPRQAAGAFSVESDDDTVDIEVYSCVLRGRGHLARLEVAPGAVAFPRELLWARPCRHPVTITNPGTPTVAWAFDDDQRITEDGSLGAKTR